MPVTVVEIDYEVIVQQGPSNEVIVVTPGPSGGQGPAGTISVHSTTTLAAGSPATVVNIGTPSAASLDFGIPQGIQGIPGNGFIQTGPFTIAGGANQDLAGEVTASATYDMVEFTAKIIRSTTTFVQQKFIIVYRNGGWKMIDGGQRYDDAGVESLVVFTADPTSGQINASNTGSGNVTIYLQKNKWLA